MRNLLVAVLLSMRPTRSILARYGDSVQIDRFGPRTTPMTDDKPSDGPLLRITSYDADTGTLYLEADADDTGAEADLTDDEMIVVRNAAGQVVSVTVPFIDTYWSRHWIALTEALSRIGRFDRAGLARAIGRPGVTTRHISAYRAARTASAGPYRAGAGLDR
ncbi:hypothetical protein [uncultured Rhodospira sp.]|uniref:hypothetical protein n=1 Tax=uncultured Rhodospira sp. TaxID=1936189 RepID=UPI00260D239E|nr:hypothetical protein [uncultured Rhodospira sp.]